MKTMLHDSIIKLILIAICTVSVIYPTATANDAPVMVDDGQYNFLILNEDEVNSNAQLLSFLSTASKEDVEEIVGTNPHLQETLLTRIKSAVEQRKQKGKTVPVLSLPDKTIIKQANVDVTLKGGASKMGMPKHNAKYGFKIDDDDEIGVDEEQVDEQQVAKWQAQIQKNALKVFKVGKGFRDKVAALIKHESADEDATTDKEKKKKRKKQRQWPHLHYKISTS